MKKKKLKNKIKKLEKIVEYQQSTIEILNETLRNTRPINVPSQWEQDLCLDGKEHDYPLVWYGTIPPTCGKCGKQAPSLDITFTTSGSDSINFYDLNELTTR